MPFRRSNLQCYQAMSSTHGNSPFKRHSTMALTTERFLEVAIESWPDWELHPRSLNSVQTFKPTELSGHEINSLSEPTLCSCSNFISLLSVHVSLWYLSSSDLLLRVLPFQICCSVFRFPASCVLFRLLLSRICWSVFYHSGFVARHSCPGSAVPCFTATRNWLLFEKLKGNCSLKRKKQSVKVIRENSCMLKEAVTTRSSRSQMLFKIGVVENFAIFTGKHPCWSLF